MKKQVKLSEVPAGTNFTVWGLEFTVLEKRTRGDLVLEAEIANRMPFRSEDTKCDAPENDFRASDIMMWLNGPYLKQLKDAGANLDNDILPTRVNLKCTLGQTEYGVAEVKAGLLTLEEYGLYYEIIPPADCIWWLATPWVTPSRSPRTYNTYNAWLVRSSGYYTSGVCSHSYGVRPVLTLRASLPVFVDVEEDEEGCDFCRSFDFSAVSCKGDSCGASIHFSVGSSRFPKEQQFRFCPQCGRKL